MRLPSLTRRAALGVLATPLLARFAHAQALTLGGETIADAELMAKAKQEGSITIYGSLPTRNWTPAGTAFQKETGIKVDYINLISPRIFARANAEFAAGKLTADWLDSTEIPMVQEWMKLGVLQQPYKVPAFDSLDAGLRDAEGHWYSIFRTPEIIGINSGVVDEKDYPKSWAALLEPKWANGKIGLPSIDGGGAFFNAYAHMREVLGEDYLKKLAAQKPRIYPSSAPMFADLSRGEISLSLTAPASIRAGMDQGAPLAGIFPSEGASAYATTGGITTSAPHPNAIRVYLNWMTSKHGSNAIAASGIYGSHSQSDAPKVEGITFPPPSGVWTMPLDRWLAQRERYTADWRATFGTK